MESERPSGLLYRRIEPGEALVAGLREFAATQGIASAVIVSCIGSLSRLELRNLCEGGKPGEIDFRRREFDEVLEVVSAEGHVLPLPGGGTRTHVHIVVARPSGETVGGHCDEAIACTGAYMFLQVLERTAPPGGAREV